MSHTQTPSRATVPQQTPVQAPTPVSSGPGNQARQDQLRNAGGGGGSGGNGGSGGGSSNNPSNPPQAAPVCGQDDPNSPPIERLRTAVTCGDARTAMQAFGDFQTSDLNALRADSGLLGSLVSLEEDSLGPGILRTVAPTQEVWLDIANSALGSSPAAEQEVLHDVGVRDPAG